METKRKMMLKDLTGAYGFGLCAHCMDQYKCKCKQPMVVEEAIYSMGSPVIEPDIMGAGKFKVAEAMAELSKKPKKVKSEEKSEPKKKRALTPYTRFIKEGSKYMKSLGVEMDAKSLMKKLAGIWQKHKDFELAMAELRNL